MNTVYINAATVGPAGFYGIGNPPLPAHPGDKLSLVDPPVPAKKGTWSELKKLYR